MDDLISRKALIAEYDRVHVGPPGGARKLMEDAPTVKPKDLIYGSGILVENSDPDVIRVVRCKNCAWWQREWSTDGKSCYYCPMVDTNTGADFYCANAERREG